MQEVPYKLPRQSFCKTSLPPASRESTKHIMKKVFMVLALALTMGAQVASAEMTLIPSSHPVYGDPAKGMDTKIIGYISDIDWNRAKAEAEARNGQHLQIILADQTVSDETGIVYKCSNAGVGRHNCVDMTRTPKYREDMLGLARALIASGQESAFPRFAGWFKLTR